MSTSRSIQYSLWKPQAKKEGREGSIASTEGRLRLELAKGGSEERHWNRMVADNHYLGFKVAVGRCLKFVVADGAEKRRVLGAVALAEASWAVAPRDQVLKRLRATRDDVANNVRFLILPHVRVKNLASRVLSLLASVGVEEWERYYHHRLRVLETFVDVERFRGTSYRAANWIEIGLTQGYLKTGNEHRNSQSAKAIFVLPLKGADRRLIDDELRAERTLHSQQARMSQGKLHR